MVGAPAQQADASPHGGTPGPSPELVVTSRTGSVLLRCAGCGQRCLSAFHGLHAKPISAVSCCAGTPSSRATTSQVRA